MRVHYQAHLLNYVQQLDVSQFLRYPLITSFRGSLSKSRFLTIKRFSRLVPLDEVLLSRFRKVG